MKSILTFNWHEGYIHLLAKTGLHFEVMERWKGGQFGWIRNFRPLPSNCRLVSEEEARVRLQAGVYDAVVAHNVLDLAFAAPADVPTVLVFHTKVAIETAFLGEKERGAYLEKLRSLLPGVRDLALVFVSEAKQRDWGLAGEVIPPGIDPGDYGDYRGEVPCVLRVGNFLKERDAVLGFSRQEKILAGFPSTVLGMNPFIPGAVLPADWDEYREHLRGHRLYLNTTLPPHEDGYNLAMLEAMMTGMPVVSLAHPTSPLVDGANGFVSSDEEYLRDRIAFLLQDREAAIRLGRRARETVLEAFPIERFVARWRGILGEPARPGVRRKGSGGSAEVAPRRLRILLSYAADLQTAVAYIERALRRSHEVVTFGPAIDDRVIRGWNLGKIRDRVAPHDLPYCTPDVRVVMEALLRRDFVPDLFLWIESGVWYPAEGLRDLPFPTACYFIDTHLHLPLHLEIARDFDAVFLAQRAYVDTFREAGLENVQWLPLACDPEVHGKRKEPKLYDVSFVGSLANNPERARLLQLLRSRFAVHVDRVFPEEMALVFSRSRIVFNRSVKDDLNMRVFEALASGSLLVTDEAPGSGLTSLFRPGEHLAVYRSDAELLETVEYFLGHEEERERIAAAGAAEVLARHTYEARVRRMGDLLAPFLRRMGHVPAPFVSQADDAFGEVDSAASRAAEEGEQEKAARILSAFLEEHPAHPAALCRYAEVCVSLGRIDEAARSVDRILLFDPENGDAVRLKRRLEEAGRCGR